MPQESRGQKRQGMEDPDTKEDVVVDISASMTWKEERRTSRGKGKTTSGTQHAAFREY